MLHNKSYLLRKKMKPLPVGMEIPMAEFFLSGLALERSYVVHPIPDDDSEFRSFENFVTLHLLS